MDWDEPRVYTYLKNIIDRNEGGATFVGCIDTFELAWSIGSLQLADFPANNKLLDEQIKVVYSMWQEYNGLIGASSQFVPDVDTTSNLHLRIE